MNKLVRDGDALSGALELAKVSLSLSFPLCCYCAVGRLTLARKRITVNAPIAVQQSRRVAAKAFDYRSDEEAFQASSAAFGVAAQSEDFVEGPRAFIEKRPPRWTGKPRKEKSKL